MNEDLTQNLPQSFEEHVLTELAAIRQEQATQREMIQHIDKELFTLNRQFRTLIRDSFDLCSRVEKFEDEQLSI